MMTGEEGRDEGMARAEEAAADWAADAREIIVTLAARKEPFTADAVIDVIGPHPRTSVALGAVFAHAARANLIEKTGRYIQTGRASSHARPLCEWIGR